MKSVDASQPPPKITVASGKGEMAIGSFLMPHLPSLASAIAEVEDYYAKKEG
jgi:hypothetical protein